MAENTNPSKIKEVRILNENGELVGDKVKISPDAADVMVHDASEQTTNNASLQDFLFTKFGETLLDGDPIPKRVVSYKDGEVEYFPVDPSKHSVWQGWYDHLDMTKKRLAGIYTEEGYSQADFLLGQENDNEKDIQAQYTLIDRMNDEVINNNINMVITHYPSIQDHKDDDGKIKYDAKQSLYLIGQDPYIKNTTGQFQTLGQGFYIRNEEEGYDIVFPYTLGPVAGFQDTYTPIKECVLYTDMTMSSLIEQELYTLGPHDKYEKIPEDAYVSIYHQEKEIPYTAEEKAQELMFSFGKKSFWQAIIDKELENKDKLIGIYNKDGECVGHFEATRYNLDALKQVYQDGVVVAEYKGEDANGAPIIQQIKRGAITTDQEAMSLLIDLSSKSLYQHVLELKDFWITLPVEYYDITTSNGVSIANKKDVNDLLENLQAPSILQEYEFSFEVPEDNGVTLSQIFKTPLLDNKLYNEVVTIPHTYNNMPVWRIAEDTCIDNNVRVINIPASVIKIDTQAFKSSCENLSVIRGLSSPESKIRHIEANAFRAPQLISEESGDWEKGVLYIDHCAIYGLSSDDNILTLRNDTVGIADQCFMDDEVLSKATIPGTIRFIGSKSIVSENLRFLDWEWDGQTIPFVAEDAFPSTLKGIKIQDEYYNKDNYQTLMENAPNMGRLIVPKTAAAYFYLQDEDTQLTYIFGGEKKVNNKTTWENFLSKDHDSDDTVGTSGIFTTDEDDDRILFHPTKSSSYYLFEGKDDQQITKDSYLYSYSIEDVGDYPSIKIKSV